MTGDVGRELLDVSSERVTDGSVLSIFIETLRNDNSGVVVWLCPE
jgi:hypothetical protein